METCLSNFEKKTIKPSSSCETDVFEKEVLRDLHNRFSVQQCVMKAMGHMKTSTSTHNGDRFVTNFVNDAAMDKDIQTWTDIRVSLVDSYKLLT